MLAQDIRDQVIRIFDACNFQDLAGQRIAKVLATLKFIEDRIARMMDIWAASTRSRTIPPPRSPPAVRAGAAPRRPPAARGRGACRTPVPA